MSPDGGSKRSLDGEVNPYSSIQPAKRRKSNSPERLASPATTHKRPSTQRKDIDRTERDAHRQRIKEADARREAERERERLQRRDAIARQPPEPYLPPPPRQYPGPGTYYNGQRTPAQGAGAAEVQYYYNNMQRYTKNFRDRQSDIKELRKFNNWVKSLMIHKATTQETSWFRPVIPCIVAPDLHLSVLDIGCGQGGDLNKWQLCPTPVARYVGLDIAEDSIQEAEKRYGEMKAKFGHHQHPPLFKANFFARDAFIPGSHLGEIRQIHDIGIEREVKYNSDKHARSGFDVVSMMFCLHYAFESEAQAAQAIKSISCALKIGGRFVGTIPSSDVIVGKKIAWHKDSIRQREAVRKFEESGRMAADVEEGEEIGFAASLVAQQDRDGRAANEEPPLKWENSVYDVTFETPTDGSDRFDAGPTTDNKGPFGVRYRFRLKEAVDAPEYVVPFGVLRQLCEDSNLRLVYDESFEEIWKQLGQPREGPFWQMAERMGVRGREGSLMIPKDQFEACCFYRAFMFVKL